MIGKRVWVIRSGKHSVAHSLFLEKGVIALARGDFDDLGGLAASADVFRALKKREGMTFYRFIHELARDDLVLYPSRVVDGRVNFGLVSGAYSFRPSSPDFPHQRDVQWLGSVERKSLPRQLDKEIGFFFQFYRVTRNSDSFWALVESSVERNSGKSLSEGKEVVARLD
jgi:predicted Mrr-cat superfamily restriction endonuclease